MIHSHIIDSLLKKITIEPNLDYSNVFNFLPNSGGFKIFFHEFYKSNYKHKVLNNIVFTLQNTHIENYHKPEFFIFTLLNEYLLLTGKNKEMALKELYVPNLSDKQYLNDVENQTNNYHLENQKILQSILNNKNTYQDNIVLINKFIDVIHHLINILLVRHSEDGRLLEIKTILEEIDLRDYDSLYLHTIKEKLASMLSGGYESFNEYGIQYLLLINAFLEQFKNIDFYLFYNEFHSESINEILNGIFDSDSMLLLDIYNNEKIIQKQSIQEILLAKHKELKNKMNDWLFDKNSTMSDTINISVYYDELKKYIDELSIFNKFIKDVNIETWIQYIQDTCLNKEHDIIVAEKIILAINILQAIFQNDIFTMQQFEKNTNNFIFHYNKDIVNFQFDIEDSDDNYLDMEDDMFDIQTPFYDTVPSQYHGTYMKSFIQHNQELIQKHEHLLNTITNQFNKNDFIVLKDLYRSLRNNCLEIQLNNLSETFYLVEKLFESKIALEQKINNKEQNLILLVNRNFMQMIDNYLSLDKYTIATPVLKVQSLFKEANNLNNELSSFFKTNNNMMDNHSIQDNIDDEPSYNLKEPELGQNLTDLTNAESNMHNSIEIDESTTDNSLDTESILETVQSQMSDDFSTYDVQNNEDELTDTDFLLQLAAKNIKEEAATVIPLQQNQQSNAEHLASMDDVDFADDDLDALNTEYFAHKFDDHNEEAVRQEQHELQKQVEIKQEQAQQPVIEPQSNIEEPISSSDDRQIHTEDVNPMINEASDIIHDSNVHSDNDFNEYNVEEDIIQQELNPITREENNILHEIEELVLDNEQPVESIDSTDSIDSIEPYNEALATNIANEHHDNFSQPLNDNVQTLNSVENNNNRAKVEQQVVYIQQPAQFIQPNGTIVYDNERNGFIINGSNFLTAHDWGVIVNNTTYNIENIFAHMQELRNAFSQNGEVYIDENMTIPFVNNLIDDTEQIHLFKTSAMLLRFKFYLLYVINYQIAFDDDSYNIMNKVLIAINNLILQNKSSTNHENFDHILALIETNQRAVEMNITQIIIQNSVNSAIKTITSNLSNNFEAMIKGANEHYAHFADFEKGFSRFTMQTSNLLNQQNAKLENISENSINTHNLVHESHVELDKNMKILNSNLKSIYSKFKMAVEQDQINGNKGKGLVSKLFNKHSDDE